MDPKHWIFLSPHFDDVALSCGGLVWQLTSEGHQVEIWTIMGGLPPEAPYSEFARQNHEIWGMSGEAAIRMRRSEDLAACAVMGARARHCGWLDVIYRQDRESGAPIVNNNQELFGRPPEADLVADITLFLMAEVPESAKLVSPIGLGSHIDHRALVQAVEQSDRANFYYADYPYILSDYAALAAEPQKFAKTPRSLDEDALKHWQEAVLCYTSQLITFWRDEAESRLALRNYMAGGGGRLWIKAVAEVQAHPPE
jgi:LmbE family N-acetylglucosaminyl deacetylase